MIGSQQRAGIAAGLHASRLSNRARRASVLFFHLLLHVAVVFTSTPNRMRLSDVFSNGHICQGVYHRRVDRSPKGYDFVALLFAALSDRTRLRLLSLMDGREVCVCYFVAILGQSQPKISRHLAYL